MSDASPIWSRPERGSRGPQPTHSRDEIVRAAIGLAGADGLAAVSMRAVAAALGTGAGTLYRHLSSRDDLLDLMTDRVIGELRPYPEPGPDWTESLLDLARRQLDLHRRHPWLREVLSRPSALGPEGLAWFDHCLRVLTPVRCDSAAKFETLALMTGMVTLFARTGTAAPPPIFTGLDVTAYPHLVAAFGNPGAPRTDLFERTLRGLFTALLAEPGPADL
ncbi:TetR/AcrR family transcriptional regulator [Actinoplanes derwentensis]|uniref:Tetracyclin repressor, C-terminal all-alpha domain n=1 Tax=Actinoplanes derwentensis TaxID=113562 RepID=A0A1H2BH37_9ACTN|nr:TetR/AcrR family transcriptional regulator [Actinoplanes derwentensis]GID87804.1 TetR family transcriptional regulator [Actinoplanes derwentensis]SDT57397.1 Tetracyclin repressor, C-terminal all-alpha domain [Actinoplanes derwentensis]